MAESGTPSKLRVTGMHCTNCAIAVHTYLEKQGATDIHVDFITDEVQFANISPKRMPEIAAGIASLGYKVLTDTEKRTVFWKTIFFHFLFSLLFTVPLLLHMFVDIPLLHDPYVQLALCCPVYILGLIYFGSGTYYAIRNGVPNMDVLIFIGATAAFIYSLIGTINKLGSNYLFYESCATIITLVFLGKTLEKRAVSKTTSAISDLLQFQHTKAIKIVNDEDIEVDATDIQKGDLIKINSGQQIPVDGDIINGEGWVDESLVTGESMPVEKHKYESVIGGTMLTSGNMRIVATNVGTKSTLYQIIQLVKDAQASRPDIQKFGDKVAAYFVPIVICIAFFTFFISYFIAQNAFQQSLMNAIATLVISCPCAMGLATPTAVMVGIGRAAKKGILIKGGDTLEDIAELKHMVFDKTGTLTTGDFNIKAFQTFGIAQSQVESIIAQLESYSTHPIARSIGEHFKEIKSYRIIFSTVDEVKGLGIFATDSNGNTYALCNAKYGLKDYSNRYDLTLTINEVVIAGLVIEDQIKPHAKELIQQLKDNGIQPIILSGDRQSKCQQVAQKLGIARVYWGKLPGEKVDTLQTVAKNGKTAMVGDGINDAPALSYADVSIAFGDASHIAIQSARVILLNNRLTAVQELLLVSKHTMLTIKQNLVWALSYNIIAIPLAATGYLNPMLASLAMAFSSLFVVGNSLRLRVKKMK